LPAAEKSSGSARGLLKSIAGDDAAHSDEGRQVGISEFDDVEERLIFPGIRKGLAVLSAVANHGARANSAGATAD